MSKLNTSQIVEVVQALVGETDATGESEIDRQVRQNQKVLSDVVDTLLFILVRSTKYANRIEGSIKAIGNDAIEFLGDLVKEYELNDYVWVPVSERLPENTDPVNITWINRNPEPYYSKIKNKPFTATGHYCKGKWYWYSATCQDILDEYGENEVDEIDGDIEVIAWMEMPNPYKGE